MRFDFSEPWQSSTATWYVMQWQRSNDLWHSVTVCSFSLVVSVSCQTWRVVKFLAFPAFWCPNLRRKWLWPRQRLLWLVKKQAWPTLTTLNLSLLNHSQHQQCGSTLWRHCLGFYDQLLGSETDHVNFECLSLSGVSSHCLVPGNSLDHSHWQICPGLWHRHHCQSGKESYVWPSWTLKNGDLGLPLTIFGKEGEHFINFDWEVST